MWTVISLFFYNYLTHPQVARMSGAELFHNEIVDNSGNDSIRTQ